MLINWGIEVKYLPRCHLKSLIWGWTSPAKCSWRYSRNTMTKWIVWWEGILQRELPNVTGLQRATSANISKENLEKVQHVDHAFISGFEYYLKTKRKCSHNTAIKYVVNFKKIIRIAYANGWITKDPFANWKARLKNVEREFLTNEELQQLMDHPFTNERLEHVRDCFVFCCFWTLKSIFFVPYTVNSMIKLTALFFGVSTILILFLVTEQ